MKYKKILFSLIAIFFLSLVVYFPVYAQSSYSLHVRRINGLGNGSQIRGNFQLSISGPGDLASVTYLIDGQVMATVTSQPFTYDFDTTQYADGTHDLSAEIKTTGGQMITTAALEYNFASSAQQSAILQRILIPIAGVLVLVFAITIGSQVLISRKQTRSNLPPGSHRDYGIAGGAICPKCHRTFSLNLMALNFGIGSKLTRCPYCGKWSVVRRASPDELTAAEQAELAGTQAAEKVREKTEAEKLDDMLDESRFTDKT